MNRDIGGLNSRMNALLGIQMEMLKVMKATKPAIQAQTTAMDKLGESAKEVGDEWIVYPWEREDSEAIPDYLKEVEHLRDSHYIGGLTMPSGAKTSWWKKMSNNE